jgi:hypothetical protein
MMKLRRDKSAGGYAVRVPCCAENHYDVQPAYDSRMFTLADGSLDPAGPSFKAYYCPHCTAKLLEDGAAVIEGEYRNEYGPLTRFYPTKEAT